MPAVSGMPLTLIVDVYLPRTVKPIEAGLIEPHSQALDLVKDCIELFRIDVQSGFDHPHRIQIKTAYFEVSE